MMENNINIGTGQSPFDEKVASQLLYIVYARYIYTTPDYSVVEASAGCWLASLGFKTGGITGIIVDTRYNIICILNYMCMDNGNIETLADRAIR